MKYIWDPFAEKGTSAHTKEAEENIRISGTVKVSFDAAIDRETAILSAMLVDLGDAKRITAEEIKHPDGTYSFGLEAEPQKYKVISRGWIKCSEQILHLEKGRDQTGCILSL